MRQGINILGGCTEDTIKKKKKEKQEEIQAEMKETTESTSEIKTAQRG